MFVAPQSINDSTRIVFQWLEARSRFDVHAMNALMDEDFINGVLPQSVGQPESGKDALWALTQPPHSDLSKLKLEVFGYAENDDQVWAHTRLTGETSDGIRYDVESVYIVTLIPAELMVMSKKIKKIDQFIDTAAVEKFNEAVAAK